MAKPTVKNIAVPSVVLIIICLVISAALAFTNDITKDRIAEIDKQNSINAMAEIFTDEGVEFSDNYTVVRNDTEYFYSIASVNGEQIGFIFTTSSSGYGGEVKVMTGVNADGTVKAIKVLSVADETPGLGQAATNPEFTAQFSGKSGQISTEKNHDVDALTGATITTKAVINDVNIALELFEEVKRGGVK